MQWKQFPKDYTIPVELISILSDYKFHSYRQLSQIFGMNLKNVISCINILQEWGISILNIPSQGFKLSKSIQFLDKNFICNQVKVGRVKIFPVIHSTNQYILENLEKLCPGDICIAEHQYCGRGRFNRKWISSFGNNLCLSMYWIIKQGILATHGLNMVISIVIAEVLCELGIKQISVKWPNDLYLNNRKLAGVLIETISNASKFTKIIIGLGININMHNMNKKIIDQNWINLKEAGKNINRNYLAVKLIKKLHFSLTCFAEKGLEPFMLSWKKLDNFINRPVKLIINNNNNNIIYGISRGINLNGALLLEQEGVVNSWSGNNLSLRYFQYT